MRPIAALVALLVPALVEAQAPAPAPALDAFAPALGHWRGTGIVRREAGEEPSEWTAVQSVMRVLDDHVVQDDLRVDTAWGTLLFRTLHGWERERGELASYTLGNTDSGPVDARWVDEKTLVTVSHGVDGDGIPWVERSTITYGADAYEFVMQRAAGGGPFFVHAQGSYERSGEPLAPLATHASMPLSGADEAMRRLDPCRGTYEVTGEVWMAPGGEPMMIRARETVDWTCGGSVLMSHVRGEPEHYEAVGYQHWDPRAGCYRHLGMNNAGAMDRMEARWVGDQLVYTGAAPRDGAPGCERLVARFAPDGAFATMTAVHLAADGEARRTFRGTYERVARADAPREAAAGGFRTGSCCQLAEAGGGACEHPCCVRATEKGAVCADCN